MIELKIEHFVYTILLEDFILILGVDQAPYIVPYINPHLFPLLTTGAIIACYTFALLVTLQALKKLIFFLLTPEYNYALLTDPNWMWFIDGLSILASQLNGIYMASILLKQAFLPLLACSFIGSMAAMQTATIGLFFYFKAKEYFKKKPEDDNLIALMRI